MTVERPRFRKILGKAASTWTSLGVAGSAAVAAAALGSWPLLAIGGVAYAALVAWDVASPDFWKKALGVGAPDAAKLPDPTKVKDPALKQSVEGIVAARAEIGRVLGETPEDVKANLVIAIGQIAELERHAAMLVARGEGLVGYLGTCNAPRVKKEIDELTAKVSATRDPEARAGYQAARATRVEQMQAIDDIGNAVERIRAQLSTVAATLEGLPPKVVRMRALDAQAMDELSGSLNEELSRMNGEIKVFEEALTSLSEVARS